MAVAHVVGGLSLDDGRRFRSHLLECTSCRARVGELRAIAHDLADVERDERRERATKRTDTKAPESEEEAPPAPPSLLSSRVTLVIAVGLIVLMGLSAWNFVLRGRLQQTEQANDLLRQSVTVLREGTQWTVTERDTEAVDGQVATRDDDLVIYVDGLATRYGLYLLDGEGETISREPVEATDGILYEYLVGRPLVNQVDTVVLTRTDNPTDDPTATEVFRAERPSGDAGGTVDVESVGDQGS